MQVRTSDAGAPQALLFAFTAVFVALQALYFFLSTWVAIIAGAPGAPFFSVCSS